MPNLSFFPWAVAAALSLASVAALAAPDPQGAAAESEAAAQRSRERAAIQHAREANQARQLANEKICYQHFAVSDCIRKVRHEARLQEQELHKRELVINAAERADKVQQQESNRAQKQKDHADKAATMLDAPPAEQTLEQRSAEHREQAQQRARSGPSEAERAAQHQQQQRDAAQRATQQNDKRASKAREQQQRDADAPGQISEAREKYDAKQAAAAEHRRQYEERMQKRKAEGKESRPLSDPPTP